MASGAIPLTAVRILAPHLTAENHEAVLARATGCGRRQIDALAAELAPRLDVVSSVRKLPTPPPVPSAAATPLELPSAGEASTPAPPALTATRPIVQASAPERYRVQFTIDEETHDMLRRAQDLLRREIPSGDPAVIFHRALVLLLERVERDKLGRTARPRPAPVIRPGADKPYRSRHMPNAVKRETWNRDGGRCTFVAPGGTRCTETVFLEFHHLRAFANGGSTSTENIALRCRRHNQYEGELEFGPRKTTRDREASRDA
jgi:hypothetical protein